LTLFFAIRCTANFFIYAHFDSNFRSAFKKLFTCGLVANSG
jgi:hypothetical protein